MNPRFLLGACLAFAFFSFGCDEAGTRSNTDTLTQDTLTQDTDTIEEVAQGPRCVGTAKTCTSLTDNRNLCVLTTGCGRVHRHVHALQRHDHAVPVHVPEPDRLSLGELIPVPRGL